MNTPKQQMIFEARTYTGVRQDKSELMSTRLASDRSYRHPDELRLNPIGVQSNSAEPTDGLRANPTNNNHNSTINSSVSSAISSTECLVPLTMQIPRSHKEEVQRLAKQEQMSDSATGAALLAKAIQGNIDMKYGAMIKPVIEMTLERLVNQSIRHDIKRAGDLALESFYSSEETRVFCIYLLRFLLGEDQELLPQIIKEVHDQARANVNRVLNGGEQEIKQINEQN